MTRTLRFSAITRRDDQLWRHILQILALVLAALILVADAASARPPIRRDFFDAYPDAGGTRLDDVASSSSHCGVCHFDFDGGGARNPYGFDVELAIQSGAFADDIAAILSVTNEDSDGDGFTNEVEITDVLSFSNTPTFPGLTLVNVGSVSNVDLADIENHLTPSGGTDTTPPVVTVMSPNGGEAIAPNGFATVTWMATDDVGVSHVDIRLSVDGGTTFRPIAVGEANAGTFDWFVPNRPGAGSLIEVIAYDFSGNPGTDTSDATFVISVFSGGIVPTTLRDFDLPGSQPLESAVLEDPNDACLACHGDYDIDAEPWHGWAGSMMSHAMRDPLFLAALAIAEQDAPASGDLCLRCHTPGGWLEGRSVDTSGGLTTEKDRKSVQCDFCHRMVDPDYEPGVSPIEDLDILALLDEIPDEYANGQFVLDPTPVRRGPYADAEASHAFLESPFHRSSDLCGTCHDVSNPAFVSAGSPGDYVPDTFDAPHPDNDPHNMFPVERTFSEWSKSEYAETGVFAPEFAGNLPDGIVSTCQDCHMPDVAGKGCNEQGAPNRSDLPFHDLTGGNYFMADILPLFYPDEVDPVQLDAGRDRAISMLNRAATLSLAGGLANGVPRVTVTVTNETGHKLPSGYPEGRRMWINVKAFDSSSTLVYESGAYDAASGILTHDDDVKIYEIKPGISVDLAAALGLEAGPSFHFVLNDSIYFDNRIPPRGFTNLEFEEIQSPPVGYAYADGAFSDATFYELPVGATTAEVTLYYQSTSKEYVEFLRDENTTNTIGQEFYDAWAATGKAAPVAMVTDTITLDVVAVGDGDGEPPLVNLLGRARPNPVRGSSAVIGYSVADRGPVRLRVYDTAGRLVATLLDDVVEPGAWTVKWDRETDGGGEVAPGAYFYRLETPTYSAARKIVVLP